MPSLNNPVNAQTQGFQSLNTSTGVWTGRSITSTDGSITITNPDGTTGNPNLSANGGLPYLSLSPYIVGPDIHSGYSTIASAISAAVTAGASFTSPANIYIKPKSGGYVEDVVLQDGINIFGFNVQTIIAGTLSMTGNGRASVSNIRLQDNTGVVFSLTGTSNQVVEFYNSELISFSHSIINYTNTGNSGINFYSCNLNIGDNSDTIFNMSANSPLRFYYCNLFNSGATSTPSTNSSSYIVDVSFIQCNCFIPVTTSNSGFINAQHSLLSAITANGISGNDIIYNCIVESGASPSVTIGSGSTCTIAHSSCDSSAADVLTGSGTLMYGMIVFTGSSSATNVTTQTPLATLI